MSKVIKLYSDHDGLGARAPGSWCGMESLVLGRVFASIIGVACILSGAYLIALLTGGLPDELVGGLGMRGYMLTFGAILLLFAIPMIASGIVMLYVAPTFKIKPRTLVYLVIVCAVLTTLVCTRLRDVMHKAETLQAQEDAIMRKASIEEFVRGMRLDRSERDAMLKKIEDLPDSTLCTMRVLPIEKCRSVIAQARR